MNPAFIQIRSNLGLSEDLSGWTFDERQAYMQAIAAYIQANPGEFNANSVGLAGQVSSAGPQQLLDNSPSAAVTQFEDEFLNNVVQAGNQVAGVGQGVLSTFSLAKYIIPLSAVAVVVILLFAFKKKVT